MSSFSAIKQNEYNERNVVRAHVECLYMNVVHERDKDVEKRRAKSAQAHKKHKKCARSHKTTHKPKRMSIREYLSRIPIKRNIKSAKKEPMRMLTVYTPMFV